ncbi:MAG TPA: ATP-dependent Clp protease proteolytic subunit [Dehalococcoidia bacterium]|nr:ATP-dependent Clp protease proteolytic subunit [Dehalococcoidia bacterium]
MQQVPRIEDLIREYAARKAELDVRGVYFLRDINDQQAELFAKAIVVMASMREGRGDAPITVYVNSGGGSVGAGLAIMEMIYQAKRQYGARINTVVTGYAYSMGAIIVQAGDWRSMGSLSTMMLHGGTWLLVGEDDKIFRDYQKLAMHYQEIIAQLFAQRTVLHDSKWWREFIYSGRDRFLTAQECLDLKLVDETLDIPPSPPPQSPPPHR